MDKSDILKRGPFYHVMPSSKLEAVRKHGLQPKAYSVHEYANSTPAEYRCPLICLTALSRKDKWVEALRERFGDEELVRLEIAADIIASRRFSLDYTSSETELYSKIGMSKIEILDNSGDIACYDPISWDEISDMKTLKSA